MKYCKIDSIHCKTVDLPQIVMDEWFGVPQVTQAMAMIKEVV